MAERFFYVSPGVLALALAWHLADPFPGSATATQKDSRDGVKSRFR